jgi:hypothetical protein
MKPDVGYTLDIGVLNFAFKFSNTEVDLIKALHIFVAPQPLKIAV